MKIIVNKPADVVWHLIGHQFEKAHLLMDPIPPSYLTLSFYQPNLILLTLIARSI